MTREFAKSQLYISQDHKTAHIHSADVVHDIAPGEDRDTAFDEVVGIIESFGWKATQQEIETVDGGCTQHFVRVAE